MEEVCHNIALPKPYDYYINFIIILLYYQIPKLNYLFLTPSRLNPSTELNVVFHENNLNTRYDKSFLFQQSTHKVREIGHENFYGKLNIMLITRRQHYTSARRIRV